MKPKTKAQELGLLSRDFAVAKDKKNWLALFDKNAVVQDPIGKSPLDPVGNGHRTGLWTKGAQDTTGAC